MGSFAEKLPDVARAFHAFTESCFEDGKLDQKNKQLIAISVHAHNEYCIVYRTKGCLDVGGTEEKMMVAIEVAAALGGGSAMSQGVTVWQEAHSKTLTPNNMEQPPESGGCFPVAINLHHPCYGSTFSIQRLALF